MTQKSTYPDESPAAVSTAMTDAEFNAFCNELSLLAEEAIKLDLPESATQALEEVRANARAQHFRIVLVSPFQGGKSTIFNTICGGRELSPIGFGLKTSAAIAEARYLESSAEEERTEIEWRSERELLDGLIDKTLPYLAQRDRDRFQGIRPEMAIQRLSLSQLKDRTLLSEALADALEEARGLGDPSEIDQLNASWLTVKYYSDAVEAYWQVTSAPLSQASSWLAFPSDWATRPTDGFRLEDLAFLYLRRVVFYLHEPLLRTLRAMVVDAPGLQASRWETELTIDTIRQAHAVICLLGTEGRAIAQGELEEMRRFKDFDLTQNVFYGYNAKDVNRKVAREKLLPNDLVRLGQIGFHATEESFSIFNARLALRSLQFETLDCGSLPAETIDALSQRALTVYDHESLPDGGTSKLENARYVIQDEMEKAYRSFTGQRLTDFSPVAVRQASAQSNWSELINRASRFVISRKGEAILLDKGTRQIRRVLDLFDAELRDREQAADRDAESMRKEKEEAENALRGFEQQVEAVERNLREEILRSGRRWLESELEDVLDKEAELSRTLTRIIDQTENPRGLPQKLANEATEVIKRTIAGWQAKVSNETSAAVRRIAQEIVEAEQRKIRQLAEDVGARFPGLLGGFTLVLQTGEVKVDMGEIASVFEKLYPEFFLTPLADGLEDLFPGTWFSEMFSDVRTFFNVEVLRKRDDWKGQVPRAVEDVLHRAKKVSKATAKKYAQVIADGLTTAIEKAEGEIRGVYEGRVKQREADFMRSAEERLKIVKVATEKRGGVKKVAARVDEFEARASSRLEHPR